MDFQDYLVPGKTGLLIGIGGVSMSPLAEVLHDAGLDIRGSDMAESSNTLALRERGIFKTPADLGIDVRRATRDMLAAKSVKDLVKWSGGLYNPPAKFRNW